MFQQAIDMYLLEFEKALELALRNPYDNDLQVDLNIKLGTLLHWVMAFWERVRKTYRNIPEETASYFSGLCCANNQIKHEVTLTKLTLRSGGMSFPIAFPLAIAAFQFIWHLDFEQTNGYENQYENFKKHLEHKEVLKTISNAIEILKEYQLT